MSQTGSPSTQRPYGLARVCRVWEIPRSTGYAAKARQAQPPRLPQRRGLKPAWSDAALLDAIRAVLGGVPFVGEGHRTVWARLLAPTRAGHAHGPAAHDGTILTPRPDLMWGTDATSCLTWTEGTATLVIAVDHCTAECVGIHAANPGTRFEALEPIRQGARMGVAGAAAGARPGSSCGTTTAAST